MAATPSGKDKIAQYTRIFVGGYDLSGNARTIGALTSTPDEIDMTAWSDDIYNIVAGRRTVGIDGFKAFMDDTATVGAFERLKTAGVQSDVVVLMGGGGEPSCPDPAFILPSVQMGNTSAFDSEAAVLEVDWKLDAESGLSAFNNPYGVTLANWSISNTTSGDAHDNEAATDNGLTIVIQSLSAAGDYEITIESSSDDGAGDAWATIATATLDGSAIGSETIEVSGTIEQYVRAVATKTSGDLQLVVAIARNN